MKFPLLRLLMGAVLLLLPAHAQDSLTPFGDSFVGGKPKGKKTEATAKLISLDQSPAAGKPFWVGLEIVHPPEWHSYWVNSGGDSIPINLTWKVPAGFKVGPVVWTLPELHDAGLEGLRYIRSGATLDLVEITPPADFAAGSVVEISAEAVTQLCNESNCLPPAPSSASLKLTAAAEAVPNPEAAKKFDAVRAQKPATTPAWSVTVKGNVISLTPAAEANPDPGTVHFFSESDNVEAKPVSISKDGGAITITLKEAQPGKPITGYISASKGWLKDGSVKALQVGAPAATTSAQASEPNPATPNATPTTNATAAPTGAVVGLEDGYEPFETSDSKDLNFVLASVFAFLGGLILNLMPCVFPVLGLKVLSFVKLGGEDQKKVWFHGLAFTAGLVSFVWIFAGIIVVAKSFYGKDVNWGFQLQSPTFMAVIVGMLFVMGLWMGGMVEFGAKLTQVGNVSTGKGYVGSFFSGVLTTVVATPCTGPFLGSAMGFALQQPPLGVFVLFTFLGLGIAAPYLILAASPKLIKKLPRPGAWMETFKKILAFPIFMAAAYFLNTFGALAGRSSMSWLLFALIVAALGLYILSHWASPYKSGKSRFFGTVTALALFGWSVWLSASAIRDRVVESSADKEWLPWSPELISKLRDEGRTIFVDFTTPGCLTCQANERIVFHSPGSEQVYAQLKEKNVALVLANDLGRDPRMFATAKAVGREGYPVNLVYPGKKKPLLLREALTQDHVIRALEEAEKRKK